MLLTSTLHTVHNLACGYGTMFGAWLSSWWHRKIDSSNARCLICSMFSSCRRFVSSCFCSMRFCNSWVEASCFSCKADKRSSLSLAFSLANSCLSRSRCCCCWPVDHLVKIVHFKKIRVSYQSVHLSDVFHPVNDLSVPSVLALKLFVSLPQLPLWLPFLLDVFYGLLEYLECDLFVHDTIAENHA